MPEISIRGGLKKPDPLRHPVPPPRIVSPTSAATAARAGARKPARTRKARKTLRQKFGAALLFLGAMVLAYGWFAAERDPERGLLMNLGAQTTVMAPVCFCAGHSPKVGGCLRAGHLGASCAEVGADVSLPLALPLSGGLALAWLGLSMIRRKRQTGEGAKEEKGDDIFSKGVLPR